MKNTFQYFFTLSCIAIFCNLTACVDADDNGNRLPRPSAYDRIESSEDHTLLKQAIDLTGLDIRLKNAGSFTLFAPTDAAFNSYFAARGITDLAAIPVDDLRNLLQYHLLQSIERDTDFVNGYLKTSALNPQGEVLDVYVQTTPSLLLNNEVTINRANISANNGVVHYTDQVLAIPTVVTLLNVNTDFNLLVTALTQENLVTTLENTTTTGTNPAPFTVFAPSDAAFQAFISEDTTDPINTPADVLALPNLSAILGYHVVSGNSYRDTDFTDGFTVNPITTGSFTINTTGGTSITDGAARDTTLGLRDITAINGTVHVVTNVLQF